MKTYAFCYKKYEDIQNFIEENGIKNNENILVQVFCGICNKELILSIRAGILAVLPQAKIIGATGAGEIYKGISTYNNCIITISAFEHTTITTAAVEYDCSCFKAGKHLMKQLVQTDTKAIVSFADGIHTNGDEIVKGFNSVKCNIPIVGGIAANGKGINENFVFTEAELLNNGVVGAALHGKKLHVTIENMNAWVPIGKPLLVTNVKKNKIYTIDNMPAVGIYRKYLGAEVADGLPQTALDFPFMVERNGVLLSRAVIKVEDSALVCNGTLAQGERVRLGHVSIKAMENSIWGMYSRVKDIPIQSVFAYSCIARRNLLRTQDDEFLANIKKEFPVNGIFTHGEFINYNNRVELNSQTLVFVALSEDVNARVNVAECFVETVNTHWSNSASRALYNLIQVTTEEMSILNRELEKKVEQKTHQLKQQFYTDGLTGLPNRLKLLHDIEEVSLPKLAIINIDSFRQFNDYFGHQSGDGLLVFVAKRIYQFARRYNLKVYRLQGDEYSILADDTIDNESFVKLMRWLSAIIEEKVFNYREQEFQVSATMGLVMNEEAVLEKANMALNYAKKNKISLQIYDENILVSEDYEKNIIWNKKVLEAVNDGRIVPFFQPIYDNKTGQIRKYEALIRLIDVDGSVITPYYFLDSAKKTRLYSKLTHIMIDKAFASFYRTPYEVSINLSVEDIRDKTTRKLIIDKLIASGEHCKPIFEILESEGIEKYDEVLQFVEEVKRYGAKVAIDDFGTGYSNFEHLMRLNIDYIKIDGSLIKNIDKDNMARMVTEAIVAFARKLGVQTVAEFVHSAEVAQCVKAIGVDFSQGYYYGKPERYVKGMTESENKIG